MHHDEYAGPMDLSAMQRLASRLYPEASWRHAGDLAWAATCADEPEQCPTAVWRDGDRTVAWGWLESPGELTVQADPEYPAVIDEVLEWAERSSSAPISTTISDSESHIAAALGARGYRAATDGPHFACLSIDIKAISFTAKPSLPDGYELLQCDAANVAIRAAAHREAWSAWSSTYSEQQHTRC